MHAATRLLVQLLTCFIWFVKEREGGNVIGNAIVKDSNFRKNSSYENEVVTEFRSTMLRSFTKFPDLRQCTILVSILDYSGENIVAVAGDFVSKPHQHLPCLRATYDPESVVNASAVRRATDFYVARSFNRLPQAFRCLIMYDVTRKFHQGTSGSPTLTRGSLLKTMDILSDSFLLFNSVGKCATGQSGQSKETTYVRLGVRLRKFMPLQLWIKRFQHRMPSLYLRYARRTGKLAKYATSWKRDENGRTVPIIPRGKFIVNLRDDPLTNDNVVIVTFSFLSRESSGDYTTIDAKEVSHALNEMRGSKLNHFLQAEVIASSAFVASTSEPRYRPRGKMHKFSDAEIIRLRSYFPRYLTKLFKSLSSTYRCYVLYQISRQLGQNLLFVEKSYHSLGLLQKKYFCSRASKQGLKNRRPKPHLPSVWGKVDRLCQVVPGKEDLSSLSPTTGRNQSVAIIRETRPFNAMELVMFILLGFLCLLIMVFVANCIVFTFKTKQLTDRYNKGVLDPLQFVEPSEVKPEHECEQKMNISENPLEYLHDDDRYSPLNPGTQLTYSELERRRKLDREREGQRPERICSKTSEGQVTVCEEISLCDEESEKLDVV